MHAGGRRAVATPTGGLGRSLSDALGAVTVDRDLARLETLGPPCPLREYRLPLQQPTEARVLGQLAGRDLHALDEDVFLVDALCQTGATHITQR